MTPEPTTFEDHILSIVDRFLHTVVVVDDRAFNQQAQNHAMSDADQADPPAGRGVRGGLQPPSTNGEHDLDAKKVTDAFARSGLICGLLEPKPGVQVDDELLKTARRADLIVIDWVLNRDEGRKALELIRSVLRDNDGSSVTQRLRTIAIYTGQSDLIDIAAKLRGALDASLPDEDLLEYDGGLTLMKGPVRIAVFAKENAPELAANLADRRVPFDGLPDRLRREFAALTNGLVTGVALAALAALRDDTHRILKVLNPSLDAAYLGHRSALPVPSDAQSLAVGLVSAEILSVIEDRDIGEEVSEPSIALWLDGLADPTRVYGELVEFSGSRPTITLDQIREMIARGLGTDEALTAVKEMGGASIGQWKQIKKQATRVFAETLDGADMAEAELAQCLTLKTTYTRPERMLQLGTIVSANGEYFVCVQPVCDSVRLKPEVRGFPFLRMQRSDRSRSYLVVPGPQYLLLKTNPRDVIVARFKPRAGEDTIRATKRGRSYTFKDTSNKTFRWVCQLKTEFAQKVAVDLGQEFAQVAVNEFEMLRLSRR
jgi:hypothetical protein